MALHSGVVLLKSEAADLSTNLSCCLHLEVFNELREKLFIEYKTAVNKRRNHISIYLNLFQPHKKFYLLTIKMFVCQHTVYMEVVKSVYMISKASWKAVHVLNLKMCFLRIYCLCGIF